MGHGKRPRDSDEALSSPRPKQLRKGSPKGGRGPEECTYSIATQNRFDPLTALETTSEDEAPETLQIGNANGNTNGDGPYPKEELVAESVCTGCEQLHLIIRTLNCIFKRIDGLSSQLHSLQQKLDDQPAQTAQDGAVDVPLRRQEAPPNTDCMKNCKYNLNPALNRQSLILHPRKISLTFRERDLSWTTLHGSKEHLRWLLKLETSQIDLCAVLPLVRQNRYQRIMLAFRSAKIPSLLIQQKVFLNSLGIFPTRVFMDSIIRPLLSERLIKETVQPSHPEPQKRAELYTSCRGQTHSTPTPTTKHYDCASNSLTPQEERELIASFGELPAMEQQEIINRLDSLKLQLLSIACNGVTMNNTHSNLAVPCPMEVETTIPQYPAYKVPSALDGKVSLLEADSSPPLHTGNSSLLLIDLSVPSEINRSKNESQDNTPLDKSSPLHPSMPDLESTYIEDHPRPETVVATPTQASPPKIQKLREEDTIVSRVNTEWTEDPAGHINQMITSVSVRSPKRTAPADLAGASSEPSWARQLKSPNIISTHQDANSFLPPKKSGPCDLIVPQPTRTRAKDPPQPARTRAKDSPHQDVNPQQRKITDFFKGASLLHKSFPQEFK